MKCPECGTVMQHGQRDETIRCQDREVVVRNLSGYFCSCGEGVLDAPSYREFTRVQAALVETTVNSVGDEIRLTRQQLNLTQQEMGRLLGTTALAISRYERRETRAPGAVIRLVRLLHRHPELKDEVAQYG